jgi:hypothetical protein
MCDMYTWRKAKGIFLSERMLHKNYYRKGHLEESLVVDLKGPGA